MHEIDCTQVSLHYPNLGSGSMDLVWHRFQDWQQLPPGFTGRRTVHFIDLDADIVVLLPAVVEKLEHLIESRERDTWATCGVSGIEITGAQIAAYHSQAEAWHNRAGVKDIGCGIAIEYHRLDAEGQPLPKGWDGLILFDKFPGSFDVLVNEGHEETIDDEQMAAEVVECVRLACSIGTHIIAELEGAKKWQDNE